MSTITVECVKDKIHYRGQIQEKDFFILMSGLKQQFYKDNEISTAFLNLPSIEFIRINVDRNLDKEDPFIEYRLKNEITSGVIEAKRRNKIIWSIFNIMVDLLITSGEVTL